MSIQPEKSVFLIINQQITPITQAVTSFGRAFDNDVVLQAESISRHHAEIQSEDGKYILIDKQSTSGTFVNGRRIARCVLNSGDLITLANLQIMFVNHNSKIADHSALATSNLSMKPDQKGKTNGG